MVIMLNRAFSRDIYAGEGPQIADLILEVTKFYLMANENFEWHTSPAIVLETVKVARDYLNGELRKYEAWEKCYDKNITALFAGIKGDFMHCKKNGVGRAIILKFLGANWKSWMIQDSLKALDLIEISTFHRFRLYWLKQTGLY